MTDAQFDTVPADEAAARAQDAQRLATVLTFADNVLREGADRYHWPATPLLADGIDVRSKAHLRWDFPAVRDAAGRIVQPERSAVLCNLSCQQNLLRVLVAATELTGAPRYKAAAEAAVGYFVDHFQDANGLFRWGGHQFIDLATLEAVGPDNKHGVHELKNALPYYALFFAVAPAQTARFVQAFWNAHVYDWATLEIGRHGDYAKPIGPELWHRAPYTPLPPYSETQGLSFLNAGNDLIYAGAVYAQQTGDPDALRWVQRLISQFVAARDPVTQLGAYQFSQPRQRAQPVADACTLSWYGDRAQRQLGPELERAAGGDVRARRVLEARMLVEATAATVYSENALVLCQTGLALGAAGQPMIDWAETGLRAFARYAYLPQTHQFRPMLTGGEDLTGFVLRRDGYYGRRGEVPVPYAAGSNFLLSYARAYRLTGQPALWAMVRDLAAGLGLGELGAAPGEAVAIQAGAALADPLALFAVLDIYRRHPHPEYLRLARTLGNNIVRSRFVRAIDGVAVGYFMADATRRYANFDAPEPYALLALEAAIRGQFDAVPAFLNGAGYTEGEHSMADGSRHTITDKRLFALAPGEPLLP